MKKLRYKPYIYISVFFLPITIIYMQKRIYHWDLNKHYLGVIAMYNIILISIGALLRWFISSKFNYLEIYNVESFPFGTLFV